MSYSRYLDMGGSEKLQRMDHFPSLHRAAPVGRGRERRLNGWGLWWVGVWSSLGRCDPVGGGRHCRFNSGKNVAVIRPQPSPIMAACAPSLAYLRVPARPVSGKASRSEVRLSGVKAPADLEMHEQVSMSTFFGEICYAALLWQELTDTVNVCHFLKGEHLFFSFSFTKAVLCCARDNHLLTRQIYK